MADMGISEMAQAVLMGYDTHLSSKWREEERGWKAEERRWRKEDLIFRGKEFEAMEANAAFMAEQRQWHDLEIGQRAVDNGRVLWQRFVEKNRRSVEEHAEQLKSISNLAALVAGFSVIGFLEFQFVPEEHPALLVTMFGIFTALTVVLMVNSFVACSLVHGSILKTGKRYVAEPEEADFMAQMHRFVASYKPGARPPMPGRTFEQHWQQRCETEWRRSFGLYTLGVPCFMVQLVLAAWIKFQNSVPTAIAMIVIIFGSSAYWVIVQKTWAEHLFSPEDQYKSASPDAPVLGLPFDFHRAPEDWLLGQTATRSNHPPSEGSSVDSFSVANNHAGWDSAASSHNRVAHSQPAYAYEAASPANFPGPSAGESAGDIYTLTTSRPSEEARQTDRQTAQTAQVAANSAEANNPCAPTDLQRQPMPEAEDGSQIVPRSNELCATLSADHVEQECCLPEGPSLSLVPLVPSSTRRGLGRQMAERGSLLRRQRGGGVVHDSCCLPVASGRSAVVLLAGPSALLARHSKAKETANGGHPEPCCRGRSECGSAERFLGATDDRSLTVVVHPEEDLC